MAGALISATYKLNAVTPATSLTVTDGAVSQGIDLVTTHSANFPHISLDKKAILLSRILISAIDEDSAEKTKALYFGRDLHKLMHCATTQSTGTLVDDKTTIGDFFGIQKDLEIGFWMPMQHNGTSFAPVSLSATQLNDLFELNKDFRVGLKLDYVDSTAKTLYVDVPTDELDRTWRIASADTPRKARSTNGLVPASITTASDKYVSVAIMDGTIRNRYVLTLFGLSLGNVDASSSMTLTPFLYVGADKLSAPTAIAPSSIGYLNDTANPETNWDATCNRVSGNSEVTITTSVDDTYNTEVLTENDYGWVGNYNSGSTTDTTINVAIVGS